MVNRSRIGDFALEQPLNDNESTFLALSVSEKKKVAIQIVPAPFVMTQESLREAYIKEYYHLKQLRHPHIAKCFGGGFEGDEAYFVWEYVRGESLGEVLERRERVDWITVVDYGIQICNALQHAHEADYVHAGLTPRKLIVHGRKGIKVLGFRLHNELPVSQTVRPYVAPEVLTNGVRPTPKSDIYAVGAIFYELLTGNTHGADSPPVAKVILDCPVWLDNLVERMLSENPQDRPHTAAAVEYALQETKDNVAAGTSVAEHTIGGISPVKISTDQKEARRVLGKKEEKPPSERRVEIGPFWEEPWFLVLLLVLLAGSVAAWMLIPPSEEKLFRRAEELMATENDIQWVRARDDYIKPLLSRYPDSEHAPQAREWLDLIEMKKAESRIRLKMKLGRTANEKERLYFEALTVEQSGDRIAAIEKYQAIVDLLSADDDESRPYVNLAKRQIKELTADQPTLQERTKWLENKLKEADELASGQKTAEARKIWASIISLYEGNAELQPFVQKAQSKLEQTKK